MRATATRFSSLRFLASFHRHRARFEGIAGIASVVGFVGIVVILSRANVAAIMKSATVASRGGQHPVPSCNLIKGGTINLSAFIVAV
jgi:hypothetical protein